jgi:DNA-binding IclR family transcriptional regulator
MEHPKKLSARKVVQATRDASGGGAQSIDRAATLLLLVGRAGSLGARLSDLVAETELAKPTIRRMLMALVRAGLLDQDEATRRYHVGPELYVLGTLASARFGIHPVSLRALGRLSQETGDTAFLSVARDVCSICLHREEGAYPIRIHALHAGDRHPLGVGAGSLALLAALSDKEVEQVLAANAKILADNYPNFPPSTLRRLVRETRERGYAFNPGMLLAGAWAIGMAIMDHDGHAVAALSIAAIESRLTEGRRKQLIPILKREVQWVAARLREVKASP